MPFFDLSREIRTDMPIFPGDPAVTLTRDKTLERDHYNHTTLRIGMHAGTHIDAPRHLTPDPRGVLAFALEVFAGPCGVLDARGQDRVEWRDAYADRIAPRLLVFTGHGEAFGSPAYFENHPCLSEDFAREILRRGVRLVGMDTPSPDRWPFPVHRLLMERGVAILENLAIPEAVAAAGQVELYAFPLRVDAEGAPVRAVVRVDAGRGGR